ncbi:MAG: hypothetical protein PVI30_19320 [Myxococcales bacterium]
MRRFVAAAVAGMALTALVIWDPRVPAPTPASQALHGSGPGRPAVGAGAEIVAATDPPSGATDGDRDAARTPDRRLPHPLTAEHVALYRDVDLLSGAWDAARDGDYAGARALLSRHRAEYPDPDDDMREGLSLLVDCMQRPSPDAMARAQRFYDEQTHSMVRRRIRRHCLAR